MRGSQNGAQRAADTKGRHTMCANNLTRADATGIRTDRAESALNRYDALMTRARRAILSDDDTAADRYDDQARRLAHIESTRHNYAPIIDRLERAYS